MQTACNVLDKLTKRGARVYELKPPCNVLCHAQTLIQGGCLIFHGRTPVLVRLDKGTADHVDFEEAIAIASN